MSGESISLIRFNGFNRFRIEILFDCAAFRRCEVIWRENPHCVLPLRADVPVFPCGVFVRIRTARWRGRTLGDSRPMAGDGRGATGSRRQATGDGAHGRGLACGRRRRVERAGLASPCDRFAGARAVPAASCRSRRAATRARLRARPVRRARGRAPSSSRGTGAAGRAGASRTTGCLRGRSSRPSAD